MWIRRFVRYPQGSSAAASGRSRGFAVWSGARAMDVTRLAATILAALGLAGSAPAGHVYHESKQPAAHETHRAQPPLASIFVAGHGWGHGVGLAQYGAYGYALHGWSYDKIVAHYYPGTTLGQSDLKRVRVLLAPQAKRVVISSPSRFVVRDAKGKKHKLGAGVQALGRRPRVPRLGASEEGRLSSTGREHRRTRALSLGRRAVGDARALARRGARRAGGVRAHLRALPPAEGRLRSLQRHPQPGVRRDRRRGAEHNGRGQRDGRSSPPVRRRACEHVLLFQLRWEDSQRAGRLARLAAGALPRLGVGSVRHALALPRLGPAAVQRNDAREASPRSGRARCRL